MFFDFSSCTLVWNILKYEQYILNTHNRLDKFPTLVFHSLYEKNPNTLNMKKVKTSFGDVNSKMCLIFQPHFLLFKLQSLPLYQGSFILSMIKMQKPNEPCISYNLKPRDLQLYQSIIFITQLM